MKGKVTKKIVTIKSINLNIQVFSVRFTSPFYRAIISVLASGKEEKRTNSRRVNVSFNFILFASGRNPSNPLVL